MLKRRLLGRVVPALLVAAGLTGLAPALGAPSTPKAAAATAVPSLFPPHPVRNTGLAISPVFSQTLVGGFDQAGNTLLQCRARSDNTPLPPVSTSLPDGCVRDVTAGLALVSSNPSNLPFYNNQVITQYLNRAVNPGTGGAAGSITLSNSSSATVNVPAGATVVYAELNWLGTTQLNGNNPTPGTSQSIATPGAWNPDIWKESMELSVGDDTHFVSVEPDDGTSIEPGTPPSDINDYYYSAAANVTPLLAGRTGQITVWGADAPFPSPFFNMAGLGWNISVVYQYTAGVDLGANPPHVAKQITVQTGFVYQQANQPGTTTTVNVPEVTDPNRVEVGLIAGEGDVGLSGDTFAVNGINIPHPVTGQTNNFFVSYAQNATDPNWTSNFSVDSVAWTLASGIVAAGDTSVRLTTTTVGDGYFLSGLNTAIPVPAVCLTKSVDTNPYSHVGQILTYTLTVTNCSGAPIDRVTLSDTVINPLPAACNHSAVLAPGDSYTCMPTHTVTLDDIAAGQIVNTATADAFVPGTEIPVAPAEASITTKTSTNLLITKSGAPDPVHVGDPFTYTITVTNVGPADAANVVVTDPLPAGFVPSPTVPPTATNGATVSITAGTLTAHQALLTIAAPNTFTITVPGSIAATFPGTSITNTATVTGPNTNCPPGSDDPNCKDTDTTTVLQPAPITITKTADNLTPKPGDTFIYTVQVTNTSATTTATATVNDTFPAELIDPSWTCAASTGSTCSLPAGTGNITGVVLTLLPLGVATFTITVTVDPTFQGGPILNTATAAPGDHTLCKEDPTATECPADVTVESTPEPALLNITKTQTPETPVQGGPITYTVVVTNTSTSTIAHATFHDPVPAMIVADGTWTATTTGTGTAVTPPGPAAGFPAGITLVIAPGGTVTFTITAHVAANYDGTKVTNVAIATPGLNTECASGDPTCEADVSFANPAQLVVTKTHSPTNPSPVPGQRFTYTVTVTNPSSGATGSGTFSDPLPDPPLDAAGATWTCTPSAGSSCGTTSGTGSPTAVPITVAPNGGTVTFAITVTISPSNSPVTVHNVGSVTPNPGTECEDGEPTCDGDDTFVSTPEIALLTITKEHTPVNPTPPAAGELITYTVVVTNISHFTTAHATFDDPVPAMIVPNGTWTTVTTSPSTSATPGSGSGFPAGVTLVILPGESVTFTITAHVSTTYDGTQVTNIAVATPTPGTNTECADGEPICVAEDSFINPARLEVAKTHSPTDPSPVPGQTFTYTVTVTNPGNNANGSGTFTDTLPDPPLDAATATWTCTPSAGSTCGTASGTGSPTAVPITVALGGGTVTFTITVSILPSDTPVTVHNVGSVTPGAGTECVDGQPTCDADDTFVATPPPAPLTITKSQTPETPAQGGAITYTVIVTNTSEFTTAHATFDDPVPAQIVPDGTWTAATTGATTSVTPPGPAAGFPTGLTLVIAPGGTVTFTITAHVADPYDGTTVTNVATATPGLNTECADGEPTCEADVSFTNPAQLEITKTHAPTDPSPIAGQPVTYTVTITNPSSGATASGTFTDTLPDPPLDAAGAAWTCTPSAGSTCGAATGTGSPTAVPITVAPNGGTVTFTITVTIRASGTPVEVHNVGSVTPGPGTECVDGEPTCDADDIFTADTTPAPITITKTHEPTAPTQGQAVTYTITVTNHSATTDAAGTVDDPFDSPALTGLTWTAIPSTGSTVSPDSGSGSIAAVAVTLPPGGTVTFTVHATVRADWPGGDVINTSVVTPGTDTECDPPTDPSCSDTTDFPTPSLITIVKTHEPTNPLPMPGQNVIYRVTVTNLSDQQGANATFSDPLPPELNAAAAIWVTMTTETGTTATPASGTGPPVGVALTLAPGGTVTFVITAPIAANFTSHTITNVATATPGENTACENGDPTCDATTSFDPPIPSAPLTITKSVAPAGPFAPGDSLTYTVTVTNLSTTTTGHATITDAIPAGLTPGTWTATATAGSTVTPTSGSGAISATVTVAPGGRVTFTRTAQISPTFDADFNIANTATLTPGENAHCDPTDPTQACDANAVVHVIVPTVPVAPPAPITPPALPVTG